MSRTKLWILTVALLSLATSWGVTGTDVGSRRDAPIEVSGANPNSTSPDVSFNMNATERNTLTRVRSALVNDEFLSAYGKNIVLQMDHGKLVLRGAVPSYYERAEVEAKAKSAGGNIDIENHIEVMAE